MNRFFRPSCLALLLAAVVSAVPAARAQSGETFFPYEVYKETLPNQLDVIVIPMPEFKDVLSYNTLVLAGARNEVEPGKSGLAHLFEHILFRHRWEGQEGGYENAIKEMGAFNNAWTWFDVTFYHPLTFTSNVDLLSELEMSRFVDLDFTEKTFRTEAGAVMGEYRNQAANPGLKISEARVELLYGDYGYGHTTIGYLADIEDMPNEFEAAMKFYDSYYRPNNCILIVTGDVDPNEIFDLAKTLYEDWKPKKTPEIPEAKPVGGPHRKDILWPADVPPRVQVAYRMPPHRSKSVETAAAQLLPELLTSDTAPLYQKLRFKKKVAASLGMTSAFYQSFGPGSLVLTATLYKDKYTEKGGALLDETLGDMTAALDDLKRFSSRPDAAETIEELKSKYGYDLLSRLDSPGDLAQTYAWFYRFERDVNVFDTMMATMHEVTPEDIDALAERVFVADNQVVVTLVHGAEEGD